MKEKMLQEEEYQNKKKERSCVQNVEQRQSYGRTGKQQYALQRKKHSIAEQCTDRDFEKYNKEGE